MANPEGTLIKQKGVRFPLVWKGYGGREYPTSEAAAASHDGQLRYKSGTLGREYPATAIGSAQMGRDESAYYDAQKIVVPQIIVPKKIIK